MNKENMKIILRRVKKMNKWLFVPIKLNDKVIRYQILLDNEHFGKNGNIEIILDRKLRELTEKQIRRGYQV